MKLPSSVLVLFLLLGLARVAGAQETVPEATPRLQLYGGYDFLRTNVNSESNGTYSHSVYTLNGGGSQFIYNLNNSVGIVSELAGYALISGKIQPAAMSYLAGPKITLHRGKVQPYVSTLFGGVFSKDGINDVGYTSVFGMAVGGGLDFKVSRNISVRPLETDYFLTKFPDGASNRQNGFRYGSGVVFRLGRAH